MKLSLQNWLHAVGATLNDPAQTASQVLSYQFSRRTLIQAAAFLAILNVLVMAAVSIIRPLPAEAALIQVTPISLGIVIFGSIVVLALSLAQSGQVLGGIGQFDQALMVVIWLQAVGLTFDVAQVLLMAISPTLAGLFGMIALAILIWCLVHFVKTLHGFQSTGRAVGTVGLALIGTIFAVVIMMALLGITPTGEPV
ncbi:YIP1 family protein [Loktanella sp. S4079]|uniref:YIP1 family protein n=1 Tax=Loktanella sp. S4079 TaxID=579483 RepID=UPI0005FA155D|nr:YIP1 family protein [Loktanella sp. S4079]KJZ20236.1 hypothetical protein TW80_05260 [Loktanella sp. S4079]